MSLPRRRARQLSAVARPKQIAELRRARAPRVAALTRVLRFSVCGLGSEGIPLPMGDRLLSIYLRDHHAASAGGLALARRALGTSHALTEQIARDRETLGEVLRQLDVAPSSTKVGLVRIAEVLGRLKLNGRLFTRSPLTRVLELEVLVVGIRGKEALWTALLTAGVPFQGIDLDALAESARRQAREVEELRLSAVADAFGDVDGREP